MEEDIVGSKTREVVKVTTEPILVPKPLQELSDKALTKLWEDTFYSISTEAESGYIEVRIPANRMELLNSIRDDFRRRTRVTRTYIREHPKEVAELRVKYAKVLAGVRLR